MLHTRNALRVAGPLWDPDAIRLAVENLTSRDPGQRANALEMLEAVGDPEIVRPLVAMWDGSAGEPTVRQAVLLRLVADGDPWMRACAAFAGTRIGDDAIRAAMAEWRFAQARSAIAEATAWLIERDALIDRAADAGLVTPSRLRERYVAAGGGPDASAELQAEEALVDAFVAMQERVLANRQGDKAAMADIEKRALERNAGHRDWICDERRMGLTQDALYLHCLPADIGAEVSPGVMHRFRVDVAREANKKVYVIMALLAAAKVENLAARLEGPRSQE